MEGRNGGPHSKERKRGSGRGVEEDNADADAV